MSRHRLSVFYFGVMISVCITTSTSLAQEITIEGVARSASRFTALASECSVADKVDVKKAKQYADAFTMIGKKAFGEAKFLDTYRTENARFSIEIMASGAYHWCLSQRRILEERGVRDVFRDDQQTISEDDMVSIIADFLVAGNICGFQPIDVPLAPILKRYGFNLKEFLPDGRFGSKVTAKVSNTKNLVDSRQRNCKDLIDTVEKYFPEIVRQ